MADLSALYTALKNADAAGDTAAATALAGHIKSLQSSGPSTTQLEMQQKDAALYAPTNGMNEGEKFRAGIGQAMHSAGQGIGQLLGMSSDQDVADSRKTDAALEATGAGKAGNLLGNVAMFAPNAMIPGANTVTGAALIGGLTGAATTPGSMGERAMSGALGGVGGAAGQMLPRLLGGVKAAAEPLTDAGRDAIVGRLMNKAAGDNAPAVRARLNAAAPLVAGSNPTAAEVADSGGIAALQRAMSAADPESYAHRGMEQAGARAGALRGIAGDEGQKAFFRDTRQAAAKDLYERAFSVPIEPENLSPAMRGEVTKLMNMPAVQEALTTARTNAANHGMDVSKMDGNIMGLHQAKLAMDDKIAALRGGTANQANAATAIEAARDRLVSFMEKMSPDYGEARATYAAMSKPINQMDVGQALYDKMKPALTDHGALAKETAASYAQALRNSDALTKQATGRDLKFANVMEPDQQATLQAIAQDLARKSNAQDLGRGVGSNTFQNFAMDNLSQSVGMPAAVKALGGWIPGMSPAATLLTKGAQGVGGYAYKSADEAMRQRMAQALLNPKEAAGLMSGAAKPAALIQALQSLPAGIQQKLPPEDILRLIQAMPGTMGMGMAASANAGKQ